MSYKQKLIDNIYTGGPIPDGCILARVNNNINRDYYGYSVRGQRVLLKSTGQLTRNIKSDKLYYFVDSQGTRVDGGSPKITSKQFTEIPMDHFDEDLFNVS
jgi:hypothetical protein